MARSCATLEESRALAKSLVETGVAAGLPTRALITDMNEPLAPCAGNAIEVAARDRISRRAAAAIRACERSSMALGAEMLMLGGLATTNAEATASSKRRSTAAAAAERFGKMVAALGGPHDIVEAPTRHLPRAPHIVDVRAERHGYVASIDVRALGLAVVALGGGRRHAGETIDPAVGLSAAAGRRQRTRSLAGADTRPRSGKRGYRRGTGAARLHDRTRTAAGVPGHNRQAFERLGVMRV